MHTIQLQTIPLRNVWKNGPATLPTVIAAAAVGAELSPAAVTSLASSKEPIKFPT